MFNFELRTGLCLWNTDTLSLVCVFRKPGGALHVLSFALDVCQRFWSGLSDMFYSSFLYPFTQGISQWQLCAASSLSPLAFHHKLSSSSLFYGFQILSCCTMSTSLVNLPELHFFKVVFIYLNIFFLYGFCQKGNELIWKCSVSMRLSYYSLLPYLERHST